MLRFSQNQKMAVFGILFHINVCLTKTLGISRNHPSLLAFRASCGGSICWGLNCSSFMPLRSFAASLLHLLWKTETSVLRKTSHAFFVTSFKFILSRIVSPEIEREVARCVWFSTAQFSAQQEWVQWWSLPENLTTLPGARTWSRCG